MTFQKYIKKLGQRFADEPKGILYYATNLLALTFAAVIFVSSLYGLDDAIVYQLSIDKSNASRGVLFGVLAGFDDEQVIILLIDGLKYQFWILFCLLLRTMTLFNRNWWSFVMRFLWLAVAIVIVVAYLNWVPSFNEWNWMLSNSQWVFSLFALCIFLAFVWDAIVIVLVLTGKPFEKSGNK